MIRKHIIFRGWVQGVGFRWRACQAAELYGCTGWVRNEWDGAVSMEIRCAGLALQTDEMKISFALPAALLSVLISGLPLLFQNKTIQVKSYCYFSHPSRGCSEMSNHALPPALVFKGTK